MPKVLCVLPLVMAGLLAPCSGRAAEWGDLKVRFVYDGPAPKPKPANINSDQDFCCQHKVVDESLVVNPENQGVANVIVFLYLNRTDPQPAIHESYAKTENAQVTLDNKQCRFDPHVCLLRTTQTLALGNSDPIGHNTKIDVITNAAINPLIPAGGEMTHHFARAERLPARVSCSIHPWMSAWLLVKDHPYFAVSDHNGRLEIKKLPAGRRTFQFWQEKSGYVSEVTLGGKRTTWNRGRAEIEIKSGVNDLGEVMLAPAVFEK